VLNRYSVVALCILGLAALAITAVFAGAEAQPTPTSLGDDFNAYTNGALSGQQHT